MFFHFVNELEKIAQETPSQSEKSFKQRAMDVAPYILGFGAGNLASSALREKLLKTNMNPELKSALRIGLPFASAGLSYMVLPKLQAKWRDALSGQTTSPLHPEKTSSPLPQK